MPSSITRLATLAMSGCLMLPMLAQAEDAAQQPASSSPATEGASADRPAAVAPWQAPLSALTARFERVSTTLSDEAQAKALEALAGELRELGERYPGQAEVLVWQGIVLASEARAKGGLSALGLAKEAREVLERAVALDAEGHRGSAYVTLGALYDRAPGWPLAFGDDAVAERMFEKALAIRPEGVDVHFHFASFLQEEGRLEEARTHLERAIEGHARPARSATDDALRDQARRRLAKLS